MSNHPHQRPQAGHVPAGLSSNGQDRQLPPPPPDAGPDLAQAIAGAVAQHLAGALAQMPWQPGCVLCIAERKKAEATWQAAMSEALAAGQQPPQPSVPPIAQAVTWLPLGQPGQPQTALPVCYAHFTLGPEIRPAGLVDAAGNPIMVRSAA